MSLLQNGFVAFRQIWSLVPLLQFLDSVTKTKEYPYE